MSQEPGQEPIQEPTREPTQEPSPVPELYADAFAEARLRSSATGLDGIGSQLPDPSFINYVLAFNARSGSSFLATLLSQTGKLGLCYEYFNSDDIATYAVEIGACDIRHYIDRLRRLRQTDNSVFGVKVTHDQLAPLIENRLLSVGFGHLKFVYLKRHDLLRQALSLYRARKTKRWGPVPPDQNIPEGLVDLDEDEVSETMFYLLREQCNWERFFANSGVEVFRIYYEDFVHNPKETVTRIAEYLGVPGDIHVDVDKNPYKIQRDELTELWVERIRAKHRM